MGKLSAAEAQHDLTIIHKIIVALQDIQHNFDTLDGDQLELIEQGEKAFANLIEHFAPFIERWEKGQ